MATYRRILLCYNATREGRCALRLGAALAQQLGAETHLLAVLDDAAWCRGFDVVPAVPFNLEEQSAKEVLDEGVNKARRTRRGRHRPPRDRKPNESNTGVCRSAKGRPRRRRTPSKRSSCPLVDWPRRWTTAGSGFVQRSCCDGYRESRRRLDGEDQGVSARDQAEDERRRGSTTTQLSIDFASTDT